MSRDKFISDNLYNMRERFKRNHSEHLPDAGNESAAPQSNSEDAENIRSFSSRNELSETTAAKAQTPNTHVPRLPQISPSGASSETARERRDLEGRLLRDLNFVESEEDFIRQHSQNMSKFKSVIERLLTELNDKDQLDARKLNQLRIEYFQAYGKFDSSLAHNSLNKVSGTMHTAQNQPASPWPLAAAIISGALIISLAMFWMFGV